MHVSPVKIDVELFAAPEYGFTELRAGGGLSYVCMSIFSKKNWFIEPDDSYDRYADHNFMGYI